MLKIRACSILFTLVVVFLLLFGILAIYSTTYTEMENRYLYKQIGWIVLGFLMAGGISIVSMERLSHYSKYILLGVVVLLGYLMIATITYTIVYKLTGVSIIKYFPLTGMTKGACRWLKFGGISIQPAEFAKFAVILFLSTYYGTRDIQKIESFREGFLIPGLISCGVLGLILLGKSLSNTVVTASVVFIIMFVSGVKGKYLYPALMLAFVLGILAIIMEPYRRQRILNYIVKNQTEVTLTTGKSKADNHQLERSICAIGSGGTMGLGLGHGRLKNKAIPESKTDFIFAVIGEEFGFLGMSIGISLYLMFMVLSFFIAMQCQERRGTLICLAVGFFVPAQAMLNLAVICGLFPTTGVTAPLVSYGGSSIISVMLCVGLIFNVCRSNYNDYMKDTVVIPRGGIHV